MYAPAGVKTNHNEFPIPEQQRAWVLGDPGQLSMVEKAVPVPK
jgi:L-iditol 2-dehydrogenase